MVGVSESGSEQIDTNEKGDRHEREAVRILTRLYRAERVPSIYGNNDPFRLADVMGLQTGRPFAIVQVKTNRFTAEDRSKYLSRAGLTIDGEHTIFEVWVRVDRDGWRMHRYDPGSKRFSEYYRTTTCDPDEVRDEWAEAFEEMATDEPELVTDGGYPWNVRIDLGGVTFEGPGMGSEKEAQSIKEIVESSEPVDGVQVIRQ